MGAIVIGSDIERPYVKPIDPANGYDNMTVLSSITIRLVDRGSSVLDLDSLMVSINGDLVIDSGVPVAESEWSNSSVTPWNEPTTTIADVVLVKNSKHDYSAEYTVSVEVADSYSNSSSVVLNYAVQKDPTYTGESIADFSELELSALSPFTTEEAEKFRMRVLYGLVPGATVGSDLEKRACRRLTQLVFRFKQDAFVTRFWENERYDSSSLIQGARSIPDLLAIAGQFKEACRQAIDLYGRFIDESLMEHVEALLVDRPVEACLCFLSILCMNRESGNRI
jgi:hypothetical protein